jgi:rSAM/selenodomain-associated transferase 1
MSWFDPPAARGASTDALPAQVLVIAKEPIPGRVKTRLTPPFTPADAAALATAALADTLAAVSATPVAQAVLVLDGAPGDWLPPGFRVIPQRGGGLDERLAAAFADAHATLPVPMVLIGMDTPQVPPGLLADAAGALASGEADAVFGPAADGGFWLLGLRRPDRSLLAGVPMSRADTGRHQLDRLTSAGLRVAMLPELTDVDTFREAELIAGAIPGSRFAAAFRLAMPAALHRLNGQGSRAFFPDTPPGMRKGMQTMIMGHLRRISPNLTHDHGTASRGRRRLGENVQAEGA